MSAPYINPYEKKLCELLAANPPETWYVDRVLWIFTHEKYPGLALEFSFPFSGNYVIELNCRFNRALISSWEFRAHQKSELHNYASDFFDYAKNRPMKNADDFLKLCP